MYQFIVLKGKYIKLVKNNTNLILILLSSCKFGVKLKYEEIKKLLLDEHITM